MEPLIGDLVCIETSRSPQSQIIKLATRSMFSHVAILVAPDELIEAQGSWSHFRLGGQVQRTPLSTYAGCAQLWSTGRWPLTDEQRAAIVAYAEGKLGTPYGWRQILAIGLSAVGVRWQWVDDALDEPGTVICSQLAAEAYHYAAGIDVVPGKKLSRVTPADIAVSILGGTADPYYLVRPS